MPPRPTPKPRRKYEARYVQDLSKLGKFLDQSIEFVDKANQWYTNIVLGNRKQVKPSRVTLSNMYYFKYFAKYYHDVRNADGTPRLPYYDQNPLSIIIDFDPKHQLFLGMNVHYIAPRRRYDFIYDALRVNGANIYTQKPINIPYVWVKQRHADLLVMTHKYIPQRMSQITRIPLLEWENAIYLDSPKWIGATQSEVLMQARRQREKVGVRRKRKLEKPPGRPTEPKRRPTGARGTKRRTVKGTR